MRLAPIAALSILVLCAAALAAVYSQPDKPAIEDEATRLMALQEKRDLAVPDLSTLELLTRGDAEMHQETVEAGWMITHNFTRHVGHSLNAVYWLAKNGQWLCPADPLSHVGIFLQYNETGMAKDALEEGRSTLDPWLAQAQAVRAKDPEAYQGLENLTSAMRRVISDMDSNDYAAAISDSGYVDQNAFC